MAKKLNITEKLDFSEIDMTSPEKVIEDVLIQLSEETKGIVLGKIIPYGGHVMSYTKSGLSSLAAIVGSADREVDIQQNLGKIGQETHKFECFLYTSEHEKYKYRVFFVKYDIANYPVNIILEESVARSVSGSNAGYVFTCNTRDELEELIVKIFTSKKLISVMQELVRVNQSKKALKSNADDTDTDDQNG